MIRICVLYILFIGYSLQLIGQTDLSKQYSDRVIDLLNAMTLEEKIGQMNQYSGFWDATGPLPSDRKNLDKYEDLKNGRVGAMLNVHGAEKVRALQEIVVKESRLGIPLLFAQDVIHGYKTISPISLAEASSWNLEAIERSARNAAMEASASGINWTFAPMVDISRDPRWGRVMEGAGEDPYLGSKIAEARVKGFQGEDLSSHQTIMACAKHFAGYGFVEAGKEYNRADVSSGTLFNIIFPPFRACLNAGVGTFMNSFNSLNGIPATANIYLQREVLKGDWGFEGFVVSDWASGKELINHGFAVDEINATSLTANAGCDMDMESHLYVNHLKELVIEGKVSEAYINDAGARILQAKENLGLLDDPYKYCDEEWEARLKKENDFKEANLQLAKESIILLKKQDDILPVDPSKKSIAVIGELAADKTSPLGNWRLAAEENTAASVLEGLDELNIEYTYNSGPKVFSGPMKFHLPVEVNVTDRNGMKEAIELAKNSNIVIMVLGEHGLQSGEGRSRTQLDLPGLQQELLEEVYKVNQQIVLVIMSGRPLALTWADEHIKGILQSWHLGFESGHAIAETLIGKNNPSGKTPMTFPRSVGQIPIYYNDYRSGRPFPEQGVFWSHYRDESNQPLYPFGYGLSYTSFEFSELKISNTYSENGRVQVEVKIKNTGKIAGKEVAQLYLHDKVASVVRPIKELKGFKKVNLKAGESKTISFVLTEEYLGFYSNQGEYVIESGDFEVFVGGNSVDLLKGEFELK